MFEACEFERLDVWTVNATVDISQAISPAAFIHHKKNKFVSSIFWENHHNFTLLFGWGFCAFGCISKYVHATRKNIKYVNNFSFKPSTLTLHRYGVFFTLLKRAVTFYAIYFFFIFLAHFVSSLTLTSKVWKIYMVFSM